MPPTPTIPIPPPRYSSANSLSDTPPPTIRFTSPPPPPPAPGFASSGTGASGFDGSAVAGPATTMPEIGDVFEGFRLVEELGRGTFGRVFLAHQAALAGRPVALKVTLRPSREPERLARLQHTNVVPVYSVHASGRAQLICMPFLGRRTLADVLKSHRSSTRSGWSGKATRAQRGSATVTTGTPRRALSGPRPATPAPAETLDVLVRDPAAVLRVLAQLAAGLDHAHSRGILHLDIKPGNVLLADTGEPMLLDFNLSVDAAEADRELVGGTVPYMAPEQLLDMKTRGGGAVDARTDLYALGVVAYELLTGEAPFPSASRTLAEFDRLMAARRAGPPALREKNPAVTPAVSAIVRKLLAPDPTARYQTAAELKEDVERQLADRPLRFARDRSIAERAGKWRRRNPRLLIACAVAVVVLAGAGSGAYAVQAADGKAAAEAKLKADDALRRMHTLRLDLTVPDEPMAAARGIARSRELLAAYGLPDDPSWRDRDALRRLPPETRAELTGDLGELAILLGTMKLAVARESSEQQAAVARDEATRYARAAALAFVDDPTPPALTNLGRELGLTTEADGRPSTARDQFLGAAANVRVGRFGEAVAALEETTLLDPGHAAGHFLLGHCLATLGQADRAAERHAVAAGLLRSDPWAYRQWGWAELRGGHPDRAARVLDRAAQFPGGAVPELRYARGLARLRLGRFAEAEADLTAAIGYRPVMAHLTRAEVREKGGDLGGAAADRTAAFAATTATAYEFADRGLAREVADPAAARDDFRRSLAARPGIPEASLGLLRIALDRGGHPEDALIVADEAVKRFPSRVEFHAAKALALARLARHEDVRAAVAAVAKLSPGPEDSFRVACALARLSDRAGAVHWLRRAYLTGCRDLSRYDTATDLTDLRSTDEYQAFRTAAGELGR